MTSLSQPVRVHNLSAWFIVAPPAAGNTVRDYAVLEETIASEAAVLHETGNVTELLSDRHFSKSKDFLASKKARLALRFSKSQSEVWESVAEEQEQLLRAVQREVRDAASPTSL